MRTKFSFKSFTTFILAWTFAMLILSGAMLYVSPPGRVAHWSNWTLGTLTKEGWQAVHVLMALVFLIGGLFHLLKFNWKVFVHYLKRRATGTSYRREALLSTGVFAIVLAGTLFGLPPFVWVMTWGESVKASWETVELAPPTPHFELESLERAAQSLELDPDRAVSVLSDQGLTVESPAQNLKAIGDANGRSPQDIYGLLIAASGVKPVQPVNAPGLGRRTLGQVAEQMSVPVEALIEKLEGKGIRPSAGQTMKEIADELGVSPHDLVALFEQ